MRINGIVAAVVAALAFVSSAPAPVRAQATNFLRIDESVEGALPTITESPAISELVTTNIVPVAGVVGEEWAVSISFVATGQTTINTQDVGLREPGVFVAFRRTHK